MSFIRDLETKYYVRGSGLLKFIELKYKIWKKNQKFGKYKPTPITDEEYVSFEVSDRDLEAMKTMNSNVGHVQQIPSYNCIPFIFKQKK